ncbi:LPD29 domain-containing protein [Streptomyces sp. 2P-4]|uniref:LPD29 domain-containing protein n=1 Tax=Streptomyces sp. 2P-4 TaxID=2931974 RepID=UPI0025415D91|nr:LPD29 domain-containing protein [Streptomyces sp. 2P-4]
MQTIPTRHISAELKRQLTAAFPGVKFSVRSDTTALFVRWTDGPSTAAVDAIVHKMKGSHWNGEDRGYTRTGNTITVTINGEQVTGESLVDHTTTECVLSDEVRAEATRLWSEAHDGAEPAGMAASFVCGDQIIREHWGPTQVLEIANKVVLPARWAAHLKAHKAKPAPKATTRARKTTPSTAPSAPQAPAPDAPAPEDRRPVVIAHSADRGIYVTGTRRSDGIAPTMRAAGFEWNKTRPRYWYLPDTQGAEHADRVDEVRAALEHAGMTFGATPAPADTCSVCGKEDCANEVCGTERPATAPAVPAPAPAPTAPAPAAQRRPRTARTTDEDAVLADVRDYIKDAPGIGANTAAASAAIIGRKVQAGVIRQDRLTGTLTGATAAITAKAVRDMREQGLTHEQIRQRLERKRAEAQHARDLGRVTVADAMIAAHAGIVADEEAQARAELPAAPAPELEPAAPRRLELVAAPATPAVPAGRPGMDAGTHRVVNTGEDIEDGTAAAFRCLDCEQRARLVDFDTLTCTDGAESAHHFNRAHRLLNDITFRDATRFDLVDELGFFGDETGRPVTLSREDAEVRLSALLRKGAAHSWFRGELRLRLDGRAAASVRPGPDAPTPVASGIRYRGIHVPASIAQGWKGDPGAAWRAGVDAGLAHTATGAHTP